MYESLDFTVLLNRMLANTQGFYPNSDTRVGSVIYTTVAPCAVEFENAYKELDRFLMETFAETSTREYLIKRCAERGIVPFPATNAILKGVFNVEVPIGSRYRIDEFTYVVREVLDEDTHTYSLECEQYGADPNTVLGTLLPLDYIENLLSAELTELITAGVDEEATEHLRERYFNSINSVAFGGNIEDYKQRTKNIAGVGSVKVTPTPLGGGTVGITFLDENYEVPTPSQVQYVQDEVEKFAPIGHLVYVSPATAVPINISFSLTYQDGYNWGAVKDDVELSIDYYFSALASDWESGDITVRITGLEQGILGVTGVLDIENTTINGGTSNIHLNSDEIPVRGVINAN